MKNFLLFILIFLCSGKLIATEKCKVRSVFNLVVFAKEEITGGHFKSNGSLGAGNNISVQDADVSVSECRAIVSSGKIKILDSLIAGSVESNDSLWVTNSKINGDIRSPVRIELTNSHVENIISPKGAKLINSSYEKIWNSTLLKSLDIESFIKILNKTSAEFTLFPKTLGIKIINYKNNLTLSLKGPVNNIDLSVLDLKKLENIEIRGDNSQQLIINISGSDSHIKNLTVDISGSIGPEQIVWNFYEARTLSISNNSDQLLGIPGRILAPYAKVRIINTLITGSLYAKSIYIQSAENGESEFRDAKYLK